MPTLSSSATATATTATAAAAGAAATGSTRTAGAPAPASARIPFIFILDSFEAFALARSRPALSAGSASAGAGAGAGTGTGAGAGATVRRQALLYLLSDMLQSRRCSVGLVALASSWEVHSLLEKRVRSRMHLQPLLFINSMGGGADRGRLSKEQLVGYLRGHLPVEALTLLQAAGGQQPGAQFGGRTGTEAGAGAEAGAGVTIEDDWRRDLFASARPLPITAPGSLFHGSNSRRGHGHGQAQGQVLWAQGPRADVRFSSLKHVRWGSNGLVDLGTDNIAGERVNSVSDCTGLSTPGSDVIGPLAAVEALVADSVGAPTPAGAAQVLLLLQAAAGMHRGRRAWGHAATDLRAAAAAAVTAGAGTGGGSGSALAGAGAGAALNASLLYSLRSESVVRNVIAPAVRGGKPAGWFAALAAATLAIALQAHSSASDGASSSEAVVVRECDWWAAAALLLGVPHWPALRAHVLRHETWAQHRAAAIERTLSLGGTGAGAGAGPGAGAGAEAAAASEALEARARQRRRTAALREAGLDPEEAAAAADGTRFGGSSEAGSEWGGRGGAAALTCLVPAPDGSGALINVPLPPEPLPPPPLPADAGRAPLRAPALSALILRDLSHLELSLVVAALQLERKEMPCSFELLYHEYTQLVSASDAPALARANPFAAAPGVATAFDAHGFADGEHEEERPAAFTKPICFKAFQALLTCGTLVFVARAPDATGAHAAELSAVAALKLSASVASVTKSAGTPKKTLASSLGAGAGTTSVFISEGGDEISLAAELEESYEATMSLVEVACDPARRDVRFQWVRLTVPPVDCVQFLLQSPTVPGILKRWVDSNATLLK